MKNSWFTIKENSAVQCERSRRNLKNAATMNIALVKFTTPLSALSMGYCGTLVYSATFIVTEVIHDFNHFPLLCYNRRHIQALTLINCPQ